MTEENQGIVGRYFWGAEQDDDADFEVHGIVLGDIGSGNFLTQYFGWSDHQPVRGTQLVSMQAMLSGHWLFFDERSELDQWVADNKEESPKEHQG
jgi:hypothetical protein